MPIGSKNRALIGSAVLALLISVIVSLSAFYGLNRYLGPIEDPPQTTGSVRRPVIN